MIKTPQFWYHPNSVAARWLAPLSYVYGMGRWLHTKLVTPQKFSVPIICIGNAVAGGAGKTPTTLALVALLRDMNIIPHIVTRGYRGSITAPTRVDFSTHDAAAVGDEALLLAAVAPTWVSKDKLEGIRAAIADGARIILLDDGLQNPHLSASANILVVDGAGFGNGRLLPVGPLREPLAALAKRIHATVTINAAVPEMCKAKPVFRAVVKPITAGLDFSARYVAFSGLARPDKFFATARAAGLQVVTTRSYPDHHTLSEKEWLDLQRLARDCSAHLLTTAKDAVRLDPRQRGQVRVLPITLEFADKPALQAWLKGIIHA